MIDEEYLEVEAPRRQPPWFLLTGLILGFGIGLLISLVISPVRYIETSPAALAEPHKDTYRWLIARAYQANGDLARASQRLTLLADALPQEALAAQAQRMLAAGEDVESARMLAGLGADLSASAAQPAQTTSTSPPAASPRAQAAQEQATAAQTAQPTRTPMPTFTRRVDPTLLPTLGTPFVLDSRQEVCDPSLQPGLLQIELRDAQGAPAAGVQINIAWEGGLDSFYTGLKPSISPGYADFVMSGGLVYSLRVGGNGETVKGLTAPQCDGGSYLGGLRLEFSQP